MVFANYHLPDWNARRILFYRSNGFLEFLQDTVSRDTAKLWINRAEIRLFAHENLPAGAGNHGSSRHGELWHDGSDVIAEHLVQIIYDRFRSSEISAGCVQQ